MPSLFNRSSMKFPLLDRRSFLRIGGLAGYSLTLPRLLQAAEEVKSTRRIRSCILVFFYGGPSHLDTWDMKPHAPAEVRGIFKTIQTNVPGAFVCEHMPHCAQVMDKVTIIRSMHHGMRNHNSAAVEALCGRTPLRGDLELLADDELSFPSYGSIAEYLLKHKEQELTSVSLPHVMYNVVRLPGQDPGFLGPQYTPFQIAADPSVENFHVGVLDLPNEMSLDRLDHRESLLRHLDETSKEVAAGPMQGYYERAFDLLRSRRVRQSLDIAKESDSIRDRYGRNKLGQSLLLARRLVEEGDVPFITVYDGVHNGQDVNWDSHLKVFERMEKNLMPPADQAVAALINDLDDRGLLDSTLVIGMGEFGRTPQINKSAGRDHWPNCYSVMLAGGGIKGGVHYGSSDKIGAYPDMNPVTPGDLAATLFWAFGIDPHQDLHDKTGRPFSLTTGKPITELFKSV